MPNWPRKYFILLATVCFCSFLLWISGFVWFGHKINDYSEYNDEKTDAIVVLTGGRNRISEAFRLFSNDSAEHLFISGVQPGVAIQDIITELGIEIPSTDNIELGYKATNTIENAEEIKEWIEINNIKSVRLITSNYHIPRSMAELDAHHLPLKVILTPVYSEKLAANWWESWGTFKFIFSEYNKYLVVVIRNLFK